MVQRKYFQIMCSFIVITLTLQYFNNLGMFKSFQTGSGYLFSLHHLKLLHFKQAAVMVFITTYCWSWRQLLPSSNLPESWLPIFVYFNLCPYMNTQLSTDSFLEVITGFSLNSTRYTITSIKMMEYR